MTARDRALSALPFLRDACEALARGIADGERKPNPDIDLVRTALRVNELNLATATASAENIDVPAALRIELTRIDAERDADTDSLGRIYRATVRRARRRAIGEVLESVEHRRPLGVTPEAAAPNKEIT